MRIAKRVVGRRIESTPSEQLVALRKARDRYVALADQLKDRSDNPVTTLLEDRQRERDARRIARAYDKSITNMAAKMVRAGASSRTATLINNLGMARPIFAVAVGLAALAALIYPGHFERVRASVQAPALPPPSVQPATGSPPLVPQLDPGIGKSFAPSKAGGIGAPHASTPLRPTALAEQSRPPAKRAKPAHSPAVPKRDAETGFVAKVLQADGTFKEEYFPSTPH